MPASKSLNALGVLAAVLLFPVAGSAQTPEWEVKGRLEGKADKNEPGKFKKSLDVSGIACTSEAGFPRQCVVIDDEAQRAQLVIVDEGKIAVGQAIKLVDDSFGGKPLELDGEGVAYDDGYFYVIGSHGSPRNSEIHGAERDARMQASGQLVRFRIGQNDIGKDGHLNAMPRIEATSKLRPVLKNVPGLREAADAPLDKNGLTIEGVAVKNGILYAGLRGPAREDGKVAVVSVAIDKLFGAGTAVPTLDVDWIAVGKGNGIRDLVRYKDGFIVLIGPSGDTDGKPGAYSVMRWPGRNADVKGPSTDVAALPRMQDDKEDEKFIKPEAILVLDEDKDGLRVLVLNDAASKGRPRTIRMR